MKIVTVILFMFASAVSYGQEASDSSFVSRMLRDVEYMGEASVNAGVGDHAPLWLHSNRYGLSSIEKNSGYLRGGLYRSTRADSLYKWRHGYGVDVAIGANYNSTLIIHQLYYDLDWKHGRLSIGAKERGMELKNNQLSSGSQTLGINSRPIPQVRLELPDYWVVPYTKGWLQFKGHIGYGIMTDKNWQHSFTGGTKQYTDNMLYHSKAGYFRIYNKDYDYPLSFEAGIEMACQFGGTTYNFPGKGGPTTVYSGKGLSSFFHALIPGGGDNYEKGSVYENTEGNHLGSYLLRLNYDNEYRNWRASLYFERFFEDQSGMFGVDYDGYGEGNSWDSHVSRKYLLYDFKDMLLGGEFVLKNGSWIRNVVLEYIYTKYQSGPIYHDHNKGVSDHIGGIDDYYNHYVYSGWQHWGEAIGNPLYYSPLYNEDGSISFKNNRFMAFHLGISGQPTNELSYRFLCSWEEGLGTYRKPFTKKRHQLSLLAEATYVPTLPRFRGWSATLGIGFDSGSILGDNFGINLKVSKRGVLNKLGIRN